jgi:para-nitrobenzyl esterase
MKVSVLMAMSAAKGLFHRAIVQSGPFLKALPRERATRNTELYLEKLGLAVRQVEELHKLPVEQLLDALPVIPGGPLGIAPVADGRAFPGHPFDPEAPPNSAGMPLLIGSNATEMTLLEPPPDDMDDATLRSLAKLRMKIDDAAAGTLIAAYKEVHGSNLEAWLALDSDHFMRINSIRQAERQAAKGTSVYMYYFTWRTPVLNGRLRSAHALEIPFVFGNVDVWPGLTGTGEDRYALADKLSGAWAEFARSGKPGHPELPDWPTYTTERRATMILDNKCTVADDPAGIDRLAYLASGGGSISFFE